MNRPSFYRILAASALTASLLTAPACGDDPAKPGSLTVAWTHGPTPTCGTRLVERIEARAMQKGLEIASASADCDSTQRRGSVTIGEIMPGTYDVEVEAQNSEGKGLYSASVLKQVVRDSKETTTAELQLNEKPARLRVDWLPPGGKCSTAGIATVEVSLTYDAGTAGVIAAQQAVPCENVFPSPTDPTVQLAGVLFSDLKPNADVVIFVYGLNAAGARIAEGRVGPRVIGSGDDDGLQITLETCAGTPPACK